MPGSPSVTRSAEQTATALLAELFRYRRLDPAAPPCGDDHITCCTGVQLPLLLPRVTAGEPVELVLPAFPAKSPSPRKALGPLPDMAEEQALCYLQRLCDRLTERYSPGVRVTICSDGRVFSDAVGLRDADVTAYGQQLRAMIAELGLRDIAVFSLDDQFDDMSYDAMRDLLCDAYAESLRAVRERVRTEPDSTRLYNGIHRFLVEDRAGVRPDWSRSKLRADCRDRAYQVIQRSAAWGRLVAERFPGALRLSIHPQHPHARKIGIRLADAASDTWITPWHGVAVASDGAYSLVYRHEAERRGARLAYRDGRPSHYVLDAVRGEPVPDRRPGDAARLEGVAMLPDLPPLKSSHEVARRQAELPGLRAALDWAADYLAAPHAELGRPGAVCPYVRGALDAGTMWFAEVPGTATEADVDRYVDGYRLMFPELPPRTRPAAVNKAIVVTFPDLPPADAPELLGGLLRRVKPAFIDDGLMVGPVFPGNQIPGAHNPEFRPMRGPVPLVAMRLLLETDLPFLDREADPPAQRARYVAAYLRHLGPALPARRRAAAEGVLARLAGGQTGPREAGQQAAGQQAAGQQAAGQQAAGQQAAGQQAAGQQAASQDAAIRAAVNQGQ